MKQRHAYPVDFFFWGVPANCCESRSMHVPFSDMPRAPFANRSAETGTKIRYSQGPVRPRYVHAIRTPVVHGTSTRHVWNTKALLVVWVFSTIFMEISKSLRTFFKWIRPLSFILQYHYLTTSTRVYTY